MSFSRWIRRGRLAGRLCRDSVRSTWGSFSLAGEPDPPPGSHLPHAGPAVPDGAIAHYLDHRFDLLGSGWTRVVPGARCRGVEGFRYSPADRDVVAAPPYERVNRANRREAARLARLLDEEYEPIDWQLDFKSGYRWSERAWYRRVRTAPVPGADLKVPWELARMHHLPQLAFAYGRPGSEWYRNARLSFEFRNQVLDFVAANPPRYGANWKSTMEVGIRVCNWVLAYWLFLSEGVEFDPGFSGVFRRSVHEHGRHIVENLEWMRGERANHYLGNIAGLIFCAAALPRSPETDAWLAFGVQELVEEVGFQFLEDGAHFEGSTAYHRFALGLVIFPAAVVLGLQPERVAELRRQPPVKIAGRTARWPREGARREDGGESPFPVGWVERLGRAAEFLQAVRGPDGALVQVGDDDSGWLFKLSPGFRRMTVAEATRRYANLQDYDELPAEGDYWMEDAGEVESVVVATHALLANPVAAEPPDAESASAHLVRWLSRGQRLALPAGDRDATDAGRSGRATVPAPAPPQAAPGEAHGHVRIFRADGPGLARDLTLDAFPEFGCYLYRSPRLYLLIRAWMRRPRYTAHLHSDQLGLVLWIDGVELIRDPGTFLYTPLPRERNRYRGVHAHDTPWPPDAPDPAALDRGPFSLPGVVAARVLRAERTCFLATYEAKGITVSRRLDIREDRIVVTDSPGRSGVASPPPPPRSPGYGIRESGSE